MTQLNADLRVIQIMRKEECTFLPLSLMDYMRTQRSNRKYPDIYLVLMLLQDQTFINGLAMSVVSLDSLKLRKKTLLQYLEYLKAEGAVLLEETGDPQTRRVGFDPKKFGPLFPDYRKAQEITGGRP